MNLDRAAGLLQSGLDRLCAAGAWLALPVSLLLFAQWPLRQTSGGQPQLANDAAQALFALYVALALRQTMRRAGHLRAPGLAAPRDPAQPRRARRWIAGACAAVLLPWCATVLWLGAPMIGQSVLHLERFPENLNPGYFIVKLAMGVLLALIGLQSLLDVWRPTQAAAAPAPDP